MSNEIINVLNLCVGLINFFLIYALFSEFREFKKQRDQEIRNGL